MSINVSGRLQNINIDCISKISPDNMFLLFSVKILQLAIEYLLVATQP